MQEYAETSWLVCWRFLLHIGRGTRFCKYSRIQRDQKWSRIYCRCCQRDSRAVDVSINEGSRSALRAVPTSKWPGVSADKFSESSVNALIVRGLELRHASIWVSSVAISSYVNIAFTHNSPQVMFSGFHYRFLQVTEVKRRRGGWTAIASGCQPSPSLWLGPPYSMLLRQLLQN